MAHVPSSNCFGSSTSPRQPDARKEELVFLMGRQSIQKVYQLVMKGRFAHRMGKFLFSYDNAAHLHADMEESSSRSSSSTAADSRASATKPPKASRNLGAHTTRSISKKGQTQTSTICASSRVTGCKPSAHRPQFLEK